jgi:AcrR family transcriptional regulator
VIETPRPRRAVDPDSERVAATRSRLLDAAERLFLEHGSGSVSVRTINAAAGLNPGAVHYHFGSKHGLVLSLLEDRLTSRMHVFDRIAELDASDVVDLREVVALAVHPLLELASGSPRERLWVRLLADAVRRDPDSTFADDTFSPERWTALVKRALPHLPPAVVLQRWSYVVSLLLAVIEEPVDGGSLVDFLVGGLSA